MKDYKIIAVGDNVCDKYLSRGRMYPGASVSIHVCTPNSTGLILLTLENTALTRWLNVSGIH